MRIALIGIGIAIVLGVAYYAISPIFNVIEVEDSAPEMPVTSEQGTSTVAMQTNVRGPFPVTGTLGHPASGTVRVFDDDSKTTIRYENYETINGPDLYVYLAADKDGKDFIDLGMIRGTKGNINYEVPPGTDLSKYKYVLTWCRPFGVLFNYAAIE